MDRFGYYYGVWNKGYWPTRLALGWFDSYASAHEWAVVHLARIGAPYEIHQEWLSWTPDESDRHRQSQALMLCGTEL